MDGDMARKQDGHMMPICSNPPAGTVVDQLLDINGLCLLCQSCLSCQPCLSMFLDLLFVFRVLVVVLVLVLVLAMMVEKLKLSVRKISYRLGGHEGGSGGEGPSG